MSAETVSDQFPLAEDYVDHSGHTRHFQISLHRDVLGGCHVDAHEESEREGYRFHVYSSISSDAAIGSALGILRKKIRVGLATCYLREDKLGEKSLTHNMLCGRVADDGIVVDGVLLAMEDFQKILRT